MFQCFSTSFRDNSVFSGLSVFPLIASCAAFTSISTPRSLVIMIVLVGKGPIVDSTWSIFGSPHNKYNIIIQFLLVMGLLSSYHIQYHRISYTLSTTTWWFPKIGVPQNGDFEICVAPQRSALFPHLNFQKCSRNLPECASRHNGVQFFIAHPATCLRTHRFSEPTLRTSTVEKHVFYLFAHLDLDLLSSAFLFSDLLSSCFLFSDSSHLCFSVHIAEVCTSGSSWSHFSSTAPELP